MQIFSKFAWSLRLLGQTPLKPQGNPFGSGQGGPIEPWMNQWELSECPSSWSMLEQLCQFQGLLVTIFRMASWKPRGFDMSCIVLLRFEAILDMFGFAGRPPEGAGKHRKRSRTWKIQSRLSTLSFCQAALLKHSGAPAQELNKQKVIWS